MFKWNLGQFIEVIVAFLNNSQNLAVMGFQTSVILVINYLVLIKTWEPQGNFVENTVYDILLIFWNTGTFYKYWYITSIKKKLDFC